MREVREIETRGKGTMTATAIGTFEIETVDMMTIMTASPRTETLVIETRGMHEIHAIATTVIGRGITETQETETYGIHGMFEIFVILETETPETCESREILVTCVTVAIEIVESLFCLADPTIGVRSRDLILAQALDQNEGHHLRKYLKRKSS
jgi:hypothetical protein